LVHVGGALVEEDGDELVHAGVGEEETGGIGHEAGGGHDGVLLGFEKIQERLSNFSRSHPGQSKVPGSNCKGLLWKSGGVGSFRFLGTLLILILILILIFLRVDEIKIKIRIKIKRRYQAPRQSQ
jgi:hypothetical protein